jgi:hypothetical protein
MERVWIHTRWIEHDVSICTVTIMGQIEVQGLYEDEPTDEQRDFRA